MRARDRLPLAALLLLGLAATGCAHNTAPPGWLPDYEAAQKCALGGWVTVEAGQKKSRWIVEGELIAVERDSLFVLSQGTLVGVDRGAARSIQLTGYAIDVSGMRGWTALGVLGSLSHGYIAGITIPLWILVGSVATGAASHTPELSYPGGKWERLALYARFPQGLPPMLDRAALQRK
jgi:hypothetical protein